MADNNELSHVGVLGMKWGVRHGPPKPGGRQDRKWQNKTYSGKTYVRVYNKTADRINQKLPAFNAKYKGINLHNKKNWAKYLGDYKKMVTKIANEELAKEVGSLRSPSGSSSAHVVMNEKTGWIAIVPSNISSEDLGHADDFDISQLGIQLYFDEDGFIERAEFVDKSLNHTEDDELEHIGILGMKWGHRKGESTSSLSSGQKRVKERINKAKKAKLSEFERNELQKARVKKAAIAVTALYLFGKPLYRMAKNTASIAGPVGKQFVREGIRSGRAAAGARWAVRGLKFYKGPTPGATVVDSHFVDLGMKLLGAGG